MGLLDDLPVISGGVVSGASGQEDIAEGQIKAAQNTQQNSVPLTANPISAPATLVQPTPPGGPGAGQTQQAPNEDQQTRFNSGEHTLSRKRCKHAPNLGWTCAPWLPRDCDDRRMKKGDSSADREK